jgi:hypothetical protein
MVVPVSAESSFFYTTDDSFGRDEYLKRSALASVNLFDPRTSAHSRSSGPMRSQSIDSSFNSRALSRDQQNQRRSQSQRMNPPLEAIRTLSADSSASPAPPSSLPPPLEIVETKEDRVKTAFVSSISSSLKTPLLSEPNPEETEPSQTE